MTDYIGILEKDPGSLWGIWFPDLPGCVTAAADARTCVAQAAEAVDLWIEDATEGGGTLPRARTLEELRGDREVAEALAKGDVAVLVQATLGELGLDRPAATALDRQANEKGLTRLAFVREAVLEKLAS